MKKVLLSLFVSVVMAVPVSAATYNAAGRVPVVGQNLLTKNGISATNVKFNVVSGAVDNSNFATKRVVNVSKAELSYAGNDNEVAAVVANELGHIISGHASKGKIVSLLTADTTIGVENSTTSALASNYAASKENKEADIIAANLMAAANYNPLATIVVLNKMTGTYWEVLQGKPANADRAMNLFNYISYAYPSKLKAGYGCNEYRNFLAYANPIVTERNTNKKMLKKYNKDNAKAQKKSQSQLTKFRTRGGLSGWDAAYELLNGPSY